MADTIRVNTDLLDKSASALKAAGQGFGEAASILAGLDTSQEWWTKMGRINPINLQDEGGTAELGDAGAAVRALTSILRRYDNRTTTLGNNVSRAANLFSDLENQLINRASSQNAGTEGNVIGAVGAAAGVSGGVGTGSYGGNNNNPAEDALAKALGYPQDRSRWTKEMKDEYDKALKDSTTYVDDAGRVMLVTGTMTIITDRQGNVTVKDSKWDSYSEKYYGKDGSYGEDSTKLKFDGSIWKKKHDRDDIFRDKVNNTDNPDYEGPSRDKTIFEVSAERTVSKSTFHAENKYETENYSNESSVDVNKISATGKVQGGLYSTKVDKNGNTVRVLEPGIAAEIGVSYSLFEASHKGRYGNDLGGVSYGVGAKGMSASATAKGELGIVDGKLSAHAEAKAEAILGEVSGEVGADLAGVGVKAKGSVNFGVGGHADVGVHDGKISCDVGLSVGVGASVKVEVDYGKALDNAVNYVKKTYDNASKTVKAVKKISRSLLRW